VDCIFLGYAPWSVGYRFLVVKFKVPDIHVYSIIESRDAIFLKNIFPIKDMHSIARIFSEILHESSASIENFEQPHEQVLEKDDDETPTRSKTERKVVYLDPFSVRLCI
jgi:hypothetical protein